MVVLLLLLLELVELLVVEVGVVGDGSGRTNLFRQVFVELVGGG